MVTRSTFPSSTRPQGVLRTCTNILDGAIPMSRSTSTAMMPRPKKSRTISEGELSIHYLLRLKFGKTSLLLLVVCLFLHSFSFSFSHRCMRSSPAVASTKHTHTHTHTHMINTIQHYHWISHYIHDISGVVLGAAILQMRWPPTFRLCEWLTARATDSTFLHGPCRSSLECG